MKSWVYSAKLSLTEIISIRGIKRIATYAFALFGAISGVIQLLTITYPEIEFGNPRYHVFAITSVISILFGLIKTIPKNSLSRTITENNVRINIKVGNIFEFEGQKAVGFSDTFDTDISDDRIISAGSLQGQVLTELYDSNRKKLDAELNSALRDRVVIATESRQDKKYGKLKRYALGTVATLGNRPEEKLYAVAYSFMSNDLVAKSTVHDLWLSLGKLWEAVYESGQRKPIAMPLFGTQLARINVLDHESLLRMMIISFVARTREELICDELTIYISPSDRKHINMLELKAFLKTI